MRRSRYAIIERIGSYYAIICDFIARNGQRFDDEIVFEGSFEECHAYAEEHCMTLKTRACWENMLRNGHATLTDKARVIIS